MQIYVRLSPEVKYIQLSKTNKKYPNKDKPGTHGELDVCFPQHHMSASVLHALHWSDDKGSFPSPIDAGLEDSQNVL